METETIDKLFLELSRVTNATTAKEGDLAMFVRRLSHRLESLSPGDQIAERALAYLKRYGLAGSPLRSEEQS
jgi:hypothetical protein